MVKMIISPHEDVSITLSSDKVKNVYLHMTNQDSNLDALTSVSFCYLHSADNKAEAKGGKMAYPG